MKKKIRATWALLFCMVFIFSGFLTSCAESTPPSDNTSEDASESSSTPVEEETQDKPGEGITINVLAGENEYNNALIDLVSEFEQASGYTVNLEVVGQQVAEQRLQLDFAGGTGTVDVAYMGLPFVQKWSKAGWIAPFDSYVEEDGEEINFDDFFSSSVDALTADGQLWGIPIFAEAGLMAYRKDVLERNGFTDAPKTWDEVIEISQAIKENETDIAGVAMRAQRGQGINMFIFPMFMWSYGGGFFADYPNDMSPILNSAENIAALETYSTIIKEYTPEGGANFSYPDVTAAMQSGTAAMVFDGSSVVAQFIDPEVSQFADDTEIAAIPMGPNGSAPCMAVHGWALSSSGNQEAGWDFIKWATSAEVQKKVALNESALYADYTRESVATDAEVLERYNTKNIAELRIEALGNARGDYRPMIPEWAEIGDVIGTHVSASANGQVDADTAMNNANEEVITIVKNAGYIS